MEGGKRRFLGRIPVNQTYPTKVNNINTSNDIDNQRKDKQQHEQNGGISNNDVQFVAELSFNSSLGMDLGDDFFSAMDQIENAYLKDKEVNTLKTRNTTTDQTKILHQIAPPNIGATDKNDNNQDGSDKNRTTDCVVKSIMKSGAVCENEKKRRISFQVDDDLLNSQDLNISNFSLLGSPLQVSTPAALRSKSNNRPNQMLLQSLRNRNTSARGSENIYLKSDVTPLTVANDIPKKENSIPTLKLGNMDLIDDNSIGFNVEHISVASNKRESISKHQSSISRTPDRKLLSSWGLPEPVLKKYTAKGITCMFDWQAECLSINRVLAGGNLVYSAPTSAGKTMVAEILVLKRVLETKLKAIFILPFISVAREKMFYLQDMFGDAGIRVDGFMGHFSPAGGLSRVDIAICTIEKANSLVNRLMEEGRLGELGVVVVDELHMVGDSHRGYLLELLLTKIQYITGSLEKPVVNTNDSVSMIENPVQIIGMSATLPNLELLAHWLNADLYKTDFRPVPLTECIKIGTTIYNNQMLKIRDLSIGETIRGDDDHIVPLCLETVVNRHSVLVFCPTKNWCEKLCETVAREFYRLLHETNNVQTTDLNLDMSRLQDVVEQLKRTPTGLDVMLGRCVPFGVAYHHAGLTYDERDIVEGAFKMGSVRVLVATSTLSSGVNLPARRVIIRTPVFYGGKLVDTLVYKQMIGRAGRKGVDTEGESILVCKPNERSKGIALITAELEPVKSCLFRRQEGLSSSMKRAMLEVVVSGVAKTPEDLDRYARCTMLSASMETEENVASTPIQDCIKFLQDNEFIVLKSNEADGNLNEQYFPTQLGSAVLASSISPDEGLAVFADLRKARKNFVLESELHVIYQVTPIFSSDLSSGIDWYQYLCMWEALSPSDRTVAELVGVQEGFLTKAAHGRMLLKTSQQLRSHAIHTRFYRALVLRDLVQEMPLPDVAMKYRCNKGVLQSLQQSAATFAGMVTVFCSRLGWNNLELLLAQFQSRLTFGVQRELCDLVRISLLNGQRARIMFNSGYQTVAALATAKPSDIERILRKAVPFQSKKTGENETEWEAEQRRKKSHCIWMMGKTGLTEAEAANVIIDEAQKLLQMELGVSAIRWNEISNKPKILPRKELDEPVCLSQPFEVCEDKKVVTSTELKSKTKEQQNNQLTNLPEELTNEAKVKTKNDVSNRSSKEGFKLSSSDTKLTDEAQPVNNKEIVTKGLFVGNISDSFNDSLIFNTQLERAVQAVEKNFVPDSVDKTHSSQTSAVICKVNEKAVDSESVKSLNNDKHQSSKCDLSLQHDGRVLNSQEMFSPAANSVDLVANSQPLFSDERPLPSSRRVAFHDSPIPVINDPKPVNDLANSMILDSELDEFMQQYCTYHQPKNDSNTKLNSAQEFDSPLSVKGNFLDDGVIMSQDPFSDASFSDNSVAESAKKCQQKSKHERSRSFELIESQELFAASCYEREIFVDEDEEIRGNFDDRDNHPTPHKLHTEIDTKLQDDIAAAMNMSDSFPCVLNADNNKLGEASTMTTQLKDDFAFAAQMDDSDVFSPIPIQRCPVKSNKQALNPLCKLNFSELDKHIESPVQPDNKKIIPSPNSSHNDSAGSECIPPTPPKESVAPNVKYSTRKGNLMTDVKSTSTWSKRGEKRSGQSTDSHPAAKRQLIEMSNDTSQAKNDTQFKLDQLLEDVESSDDDNEGDTSQDIDQPSRIPPATDDDIPCTNTSFSIIDVTANKKLFSTFCREWRSKPYFSIALACEDMPKKQPVVTKIGGNFKKSKKKNNYNDIDEELVRLQIHGVERTIVGMAVCWENRDAYYIAFTNHRQQDLDDSLAPAAIDDELSLDCRLQVVQTVLQSSKPRTVIAFDVKEQYKALSRTCDVVPRAKFEDPKVALWLFDPGAREKTLHGMVTNFLPFDVHLLEAVGGGIGLASLGMTTKNPGPGRVRAATESVLVLHLMQYFNNKLKEDNLFTSFHEIEMPSVICLARMEMNGMGFSHDICEQQKNVMQMKLTTLEVEAYRLANHSFSLSSPEDVGQVLFVELGLPPSGDPAVPACIPKKVRGGRGQNAFSTSKDILSKLVNMHPLPSIILEWRRINCALTKVVYPYMKCRQFNSTLEMDRIYSVTQTHTATGRVTMSEPNFQNIPKDFDIQTKPEDSVSGEHITAVSMRHAFLPFKDGVIVAADYSQLELRMIAHLSGDMKLIRILNSGEDVFKQITAQWKNKDVHEVTAEERQQAKQICYGMIYGIGPKALGEQLQVDLEEAAQFIETFKAKYTGMRSYLRDTVNKCRDVGYVQTLLGRKRYLPAIKDTNPHARAHAERQAVNTTVQGSAADMVKKAMINIDDELQRVFPNCRYSHTHKSNNPSSDSLRRHSRRLSNHHLSGAFFILQLHDELIYEVAASDLIRVAQIIKTNMENAMQLSVKFPVKIQAGPTWGSLTELEP
ncbi:DNA polymerase theta-like [Tubulanus polymorphus]|uniref:DNA polymerase theta-like n=1 Tax=Tubulanus polymorphus TaxID=672921 RepID=UPI003DA1FAF0